ncbi:uncharacterized protein LOC110860151 isoform X2 [Folsomia candida]|uniref:uncharacterized protein LOC110860151 isoform X2 n=1 Tax=Folsomia candida TaxID=158441 RepID=UPI0016050641|nr:uncharacterized protein LOC110860151 isoform X2 [Folsomia candida]
MEIGELKCHEFDVQLGSDLEFARKPEAITRAFKTCHGMEIDTRIGEIRLLLSEQKGVKSVPSFSIDDIKFVFKNCGIGNGINLAFCDLEEFTYCKYIPATLQDTNILSTLLSVRNVCYEYAKFSVNATKTIDSSDSLNDLHIQIQCGMVEPTVTIHGGGIIKYNFTDVDVTLILKSGDQVEDDHFLILTNTWDAFLASKRQSHSRRTMSRFNELTKLVGSTVLLFGMRRSYESSRTAISLHLSRPQPNLNSDEINPQEWERIQSREKDISADIKQFRTGWDPPHPMNREENAQKEWKDILRRCEMKEHLVDSSFKTTIMNQIREHLRLADQRRFDFCAKSLSQDYNVDYGKIRALIPSYLDGSAATLKTLTDLCVRGTWKYELERAEKLIDQFEKSFLCTRRGRLKLNSALGYDAMFL